MIFVLIWIYAGLTSWKWIYSIPQISFLLPNIKWYFRDVKNKNIWFLNWKLSFFVWIFILFLFYYLELISNIWNLIQVLGFIIFPLALMVNIAKNRYFLILIWIFAIAFGSWYELFVSFLNWVVKWIDISYTLLPFTVFVFFLKDIKKYI